ncbi:MAG: 1-deoxy-D-xylulose 5-phosphate reductoisomerase [Phycisphaerae bacterium]|nr:MAG: 1-deoxy-D-xylulose 5-phosphate reductoisomerase [Phycisphaerae bacterium]
MTTRRIIILGSTGSIGTQALDVIAHVNTLHAAGRSPDRLEVVGLAAGANASLLAEQAAAFNVRDLALREGDPTRVTGAGLRVGPDAAERLVREVDCDLVLSAMVGLAGLPATLAAIELRRDLALANKETLVAAGAIVIPAISRAGVMLYPVDSEHAGAYQAFRRCAAAPPPLWCGDETVRLTLTASGGAFRDWPAGRAATATPADAMRHPTWRMGPKVTIDSASLMNKALELIEAHHMFNLPASKLDAVIHPQSIVHALVEYADGSVVAQLALPDMRLPIQAALTGEDILPGMAPRLDLAAVGSLTFYPIDHERFPAVRLGLRAIEAGGTAGAILNAANEEAVRLFLDPVAKLPFDRITDLAVRALDAVPVRDVTCLRDVLDADAKAREWVRSAYTKAGAQ